MHILKWAVLLSLYWLLLSGYFQPLLLSFGLVSVAIVLLVLKRMDKVDKSPKPVNTSIEILGYFAWLIGQIVNSSIHVTKLIWGSPNKVSPTLAKIDIKQIPKSSQVLYANSITLTPGTLSVDLDEDVVTVHALEADSITELKQGEMEQKISAIWGGKQ